MSRKKIWIYLLSITIASCSKEVPHLPKQPSSAEAMELENEQPMINIQEFGVFGDGKTDVTDAIQNAVNKASNLFFPNGDYVISRPIRLNSFNHLTGDDNTKLILSDKVAEYEDFDFFTIVRKENVYLNHFKIVGHNFGLFNPVYAVKILTSKDILVKNFECNQTGIVQTGIAAQNKKYKDIDFQTDGNEHIFIDSCWGIGYKSRQQTVIEGVDMHYVNHWRVEHTTLKNYRAGVTWWGGDSNTNMDGAASNERKCADGVVDHVHVEHVGIDVSGSGIWGSMGSNITVTNSYVKDAGDTGIDFEGCVQSVAKSDTSIDGHNGALATFFLCNDILFTDNVVKSSSSKNLLVRINNGDQNPENRGIQFVNNVFDTGTDIGTILEDGAVDELVFSGNQLRNTVLNFTSNNNQTINISYNNFWFGNPLKYGAPVIEAGHNNKGLQLTIDYNYIFSEFQQPEAAYAIHVFQDQSINEVITRLHNNAIVGFTSNYLITWDSNNVRNQCKTLVSGWDTFDQLVSKIDKNGVGDQAKSILVVNGSKI